MTVKEGFFQWVQNISFLTLSSSPLPQLVTATLAQNIIFTQVISLANTDSFFTTQFTYHLFCESLFDSPDVPLHGIIGLCSSPY